MRVLVTGGAGYIGSHTCVVLLEKGYDIVMVDDLSNSHEKAVSRVKEISGKDFPFYNKDVCDENALEEIFSAHAIDCVIHFAGFKAVGESVYKPLEYYENNLHSTLALCKTMVAHKVHNFIFSSSATVYLGDNSMPLDEASDTGCINPYGWTKYMNEQILRDVAVAYPDFSVINLRYFNPVGAHESGKIGEDPSGIPNNLMPYIAQVAVGRLEKLAVYGDDYDTPDGTCVRDYIHVMDLAEGHVAAIDYCAKHKGSVEINLGTGKGSSVFDMIHAFERATGIDIPYDIAPRRAGDNPVSYAGTKKAEELLGWTAKKNVDDMCADLWRWQKNNPLGYASK